MLTLEEEGAYIRLIASCWQHGSIPDDPELCAKIIGKGCSTTLARVVQALFQPSSEKGRLIHDRLESERIKQECWREKSSKGGKKSAEIRANSRVVEPPFKQDACNHLATFLLQSSSSSSPCTVQKEGGGPQPHPKIDESPVRNFPEVEIPSQEEFIAYCRSITLIADWYSKDKYLAACQSNWERHPNWRAYAARCKSWWEADGRPMSPTNKFGKPKRRHIDL